jgi:hypothetical protein
MAVSASLLGLESEVVRPCLLLAGLRSQLLHVPSTLGGGWGQSSGVWRQRQVHTQPARLRLLHRVSCAPGGRLCTSCWQVHCTELDPVCHTVMT